jgi:hypothetical protein
MWPLRVLNDRPLIHLPCRLRFPLKRPSRGTLLSVPAVLCSTVYIERGASRYSLLDDAGFKTIRLPVTDCIFTGIPALTCKVSRQLTPELVRRLNPRLDSGLRARLSRELTAGLALRVKSPVTAQLDPDFDPHLTARFKPLLGPRLTSRLTSRFSSRLEPGLRPCLTPEFTPDVTHPFPLQVP